MDGNCSKETFLLFNTLDIAPLRSSPFGLVPEPGEESVSYTHLRAPRDLSTSRMPSSA